MTYRLFISAFSVVDGDGNKIENNNHKTHFLSTVDVNNYVFIDAEVFTINQLMTQLKRMMKLEKFNKPKGWLHNRMLARLLLLQK